MTTLICMAVFLAALYANQVYYNSETFHRCDDGTWVELLSRWTLFKSKSVSLFFHKFHTSDNEDLHDHPWDFISIPVWRGYNEEVVDYANTPVIGDLARITKRIRPCTINFRRAEHIHRVVLIDDKPAYTIVIALKNRRAWGFWVKGLWIYWRNYDNKRRCS